MENTSDFRNAFYIFRFLLFRGKKARQIYRDTSGLEVANKKRKAEEDKALSGSPFSEEISKVRERERER